VKSISPLQPDEQNNERVLVFLILPRKIKKTSTRSKYLLVVSGEKSLFTQPHEKKSCFPFFFNTL